MKLACQRCKRKKIKCDRVEPRCNHCSIAQHVCEYIERRPRPRMAQQRVDVHALNQRIVELERSLANKGSAVTPEPGSPSSPARLLAVDSGVTLPDETISEASPNMSLVAENGQESWIYRMATDAQRNFQSQVTPDSPPARIDNALSLLNEVLEELGRLRIRNGIGKDHVHLELSQHEAVTCVEAFFALANNMVLPDFAPTMLDKNLLLALPAIFSSPYVNVDPVLKVLYYNALFYGLQETRPPGGRVVRTAYLKLLEAVPAWLDAPSGRSMDAFTAALTTWTALTNHDYQLSWRFHCKSCHHIKTEGIDNLDITPAKSFEEETNRNDLRYLYWHILCTDLTFRLFYARPTVVRWVPDKVRPPSVFNSNNMHPSARQVMVLCVWVQYTLITAEAINFIDNTPVGSRDEAYTIRVEGFCTRLAALLEEWKIEAATHEENISTRCRFVMADHIMNTHTMIIGIQRLARSTSESRRVDCVSLASARKVVGLILEFYRNTTEDDTNFLALHFISFYPFCAVFSLYQHIISCPDPEECQQDIMSLEKLGTLMARAATVRADFVTFERTINALNKVARAIQDERRQKHVVSSATATVYQPPIFDTFQDFANTIPDFDASTLQMFGDISTDQVAGGGFHPMGFVRALENDFVGRNWNEHWWDTV